MSSNIETLDITYYPRKIITKYNFDKSKCAYCCEEGDVEIKLSQEDKTTYRLCDDCYSLFKNPRPMNPAQCNFGGISLMMKKRELFKKTKEGLLNE